MKLSLKVHQNGWDDHIILLCLLLGQYVFLLTKGLPVSGEPVNQHMYSLYGTCSTKFLKAHAVGMKHGPLCEYEIKIVNIIHHKGV